MYWLIEQNILDEVVRAKDAARVVTADQIAAVESRMQTQAPTLKISGDVATIPVRGVLLKEADWVLEYFGIRYTTYAGVASLIAEAEASAHVKSITLDIDSGGGQVDGLFDALAAIQSAKKPVRAVVDGMAASAAYAIASQADEIVAVRSMSTFGSIGVVASYYVSDRVVDITSTEAPNKRPNVATEDGQAVVREFLDEIHALFVDAIAMGRGTDVATVNKTFGRGSVMLADNAQKRGMIDAIGSVSGPENLKEKAAASGENKKQERKTMDVKTLKAEHPELFAEVMRTGVMQERDRVDAHLTLGDASGAMDVARAAIADGSELTAGLQAKYMAAGLKKRDIEARGADESSAGDGSNEDAPKGQADAVLALVAKQIGGFDA